MRYIFRRLRNTAEATAAEAVDVEALVLAVMAVAIKGGECRRIRSKTLVADEGPTWATRKAEIKDETRVFLLTTWYRFCGRCNVGSWGARQGSQHVSCAKSAM